MKPYHWTKCLIKEPTKVITCTSHPHPNNHYAEWNIQYKFPWSNNEAFNYCELEPQWGRTEHHFNLSPHQQLPRLLSSKNLHVSDSCVSWNSFRSQICELPVSNKSPWPISTFFFFLGRVNGGEMADNHNQNHFSLRKGQFDILIPSVIGGSLKADNCCSAFLHICAVN